MDARLQVRMSVATMKHRNVAVGGGGSKIFSGNPVSSDQRATLRLRSEEGHWMTLAVKEEGTRSKLCNKLPRQVLAFED